MTKRWRLTKILSLLLLCGSSAAASSPTGSSSAGTRICRITFSADGTIDATELQNYLALKPGDALESGKLRASIEKLYNSGNFYYIECTAQQEGCGLWLDFRLVVKRYFSKFLLRGSQKIKNLDSDLARLFPLGEPFSENRLHRFATEAERFLFDRGYSGIALSPTYAPEPESKGINIFLTVPDRKPASLGKIAFFGESALPEPRLLKSAKLKPGKPYSKEKLLAAVERLKELHVNHGYLAPKIAIQSTDFREQSNEVDVAFRIQSGLPIQVSIAGAQVTKTKLRELLPFYREADLDVDLLQEGKENLQAYLLGLGYSSADIDFTSQLMPDGEGMHVVYRTKLGQKLIVDRIDIQGLQALDRGGFISLLGKGPAGIRSGKYFTLLGFERATQRIIADYRDRGYLDAQFVRRDLTIAEKGVVDLEFEIEEGGSSVIRKMAISGSQKIPWTELSRRISLAPEKPFSEQKLESDRKSIQEYYLEKGFPNSRVQATWQREGAAVDISVLIEEGQRLNINKIAVVGNERTHLPAIMKNLGFKSGDNLVVKRLFEGEQKLYNTSGFDQVRIRATDTELKDPLQTVIVGVRETHPRVLNFGVGYQDFEGPRGLFELTYLNVGGSLRTAQVRLRGSKINQSIQLSLREPRPLNRNFESFATLQASRKEEVSFTEERYGASLQLLRDLSRVNTLAFGYSYEHVNVRDAKVAISEIPRVSQPINLASFSTAFINDSRDNLVDPKRGAFSSANVQVTSPLIHSDAQFIKFFGQSQYYRRLPKGFLMVEAFRVGMAQRFDGKDPLLPISERFFAGGATTLRGFSNDEAGPRDAATNQPVGGNALIINNVELRFPIVSRFGGVVFYDTGNVFSLIKDIQLSNFTNSLGFGLKIQTPIGPIRFDYGFNLNPVPGLARQHFFLSFGPIF